ncbi:MAG: beta-N-acetylhexosaminidase [Gammaproteobacteria bacterium]|nr:beta-N-acetylhexosaminidase [Gammaproteobacteria bacterium]MCY4228739.1 beta-N-acetylhexosaminidase [Gammaproteobacteria bacterium]
MPNLPLGPLIVDIPDETLSPEDIVLLRSPAIGGVILFSRNYRSRQQVTGLIAEVRALRSPPLLICVDQEGGRVQRFQDGFFRLPSARQIGIKYGQDMQQGLQLARKLGMMMAGELVLTGVDISFAPVLDCAHPESRVIGDRSFSSDPNAVTSLAGEFISGMRQAGMAATGKHYPGHGGVREDSHEMQPVDRRELTALLDRDLVPFQELARRLTGIMTAHVQFPLIDTAIPSFSHYWLETILRRRLGFTGTVFSDDLTMGGAGQGGEPLERAHSALRAGCDMILVCNDRAAALEIAEQLGEEHNPDPVKINLLRASKHLSTLDLALIRASLPELS